MSAAVREALAWIAVDWGSSNLRAWALDVADRVLGRGELARGMLSLTAPEYEAALLTVINDWLPESVPANGPVEVWVCGMAGARQGWQEAAYRPVPAALARLGDGAVMPEVADARFQVRLLPGLCQHRDDERDFDVMRGEETQLAGLVADRPDFSGLACLPGTHAKWAWLEAGQVVRFTTFLTGELYRLLAETSVLAHSLGADDLDEPAQRAAFVAAVQDAAAHPAAFSARLFGLRARDLLDEALPAGEARRGILAARLSGLVIGLELAGVGLESNDAPVLIGAPALAARYALALDALGVASHAVDGEATVLAGLRLAHSS